MPLTRHEHAPQDEGVEAPARERALLSRLPSVDMTPEIYCRRKYVTKDSERIDKLGDLAEALFHSLCVKARISDTKTGKDNRGWDFFVEFPNNRLPVFDIDAQPPAVKALVQVKGTDRHAAKNASMKLSNWERLATTPLPTFVFIACFDGEDDPKQCYLCHIDAERIGKALKQIREMDAAGEKDLHAHEMIITARNEEAIEASGVALRNAVSAAVGFDLSAYTKTKTTIVDAIGYETGRYSLSFSTTTSVEAFADALIGLGDLEVVGGKVSTLRFGIPIETDTFREGTLRLEPTSALKCDVTAICRKPAMRATFRGSVFSGNIPGLSPDHYKIRISSGAIIDIIISKEGYKFRFHVEPKMDYTLSELQSAMNFICACQKGATIEFADSKSVFCKFDLDRSARIGAISEYSQRANLIRRYLDLCNFREDVSMNIDGLFDPPDSMSWIKACLRPKCNVRLEVTNRTVSAKTKGIVATIIHVRFDGLDHVAFFYWDADFSIRNGTVKAVAKRPKLFDSVVICAGEYQKLSDSYKRFEQFVREISKGNLMIRSLATQEEFAQTSESA